jgi:methylthioribose-1-phosphate isomerase
MNWSTIEWQNGFLKILDQTLLPAEVKYIVTDKYETVAEAIRRLQVRGAPAIGIAAAFGVVLGARQFRQDPDFSGKVSRVIKDLAGTRPTAVNLF